jgi:hypothetical protein
LSRNISGIEKIIILIVISGIVLGLGGYFIAYPAYQGIGEVETKIEQKESQIVSAHELRRRDIELSATYVEAREKALVVHEGFFEEMTNTEAVTMVQEILNGANNGNGFTDHAGIFITDIGEASLSLQLFRGGRDVRYSLREYAFLFVSQEEVDAAAVDEEEVWDPIFEIVRYILDSSEDSDEFAEKIAELTESTTTFMRVVSEILKDRDSGISDESRSMFLDILRIGLATESIGAGLITATFVLEMTYAQYLDFLDYLHEYPLRMGINTATLFQSVESQAEAFGDEDDGGLILYSFNLSLYVVRPMEIPESRFSPSDEQSEDESEESEKAEEE